MHRYAQESPRRHVVSVSGRVAACRAETAGIERVPRRCRNGERRRTGAWRPHKHRLRMLDMARDGERSWLVAGASI